MKIVNFYCYGLIGESDPLLTILTGESDPVISSQKVVDFLKANQVAGEIVVHINSRGGSVNEGFAIYDLLTTSGKKITTIIEGQAASIASVVALAGSTRKITQNSQVMIHNPWIDPSSIQGLEASELQRMADDMKREEARILDFYANKTGMDKTMLADMMNKETSFDAAKALEMKFVTEIIQPSKAMAFINNSKPNISQMEKTILEKIGQKFDSLFDKLKIKNEAEAPVGFKAKTSDGSEINISDDNGDGIAAIGDMVTDASGNPTPDATYVLDTGDTITTDSSGKISAIQPAAGNQAAAVLNKIMAAKYKIKMPQMGDTISFDGSPVPDTTFTMPDGTTIHTDANAKVVGIVPPKNKPAAPAQPAQPANEIIALRAKVLQLETENSNYKSSLESFDKKLELLASSHIPKSGEQNFNSFEDPNKKRKSRVKEMLAEEKK